MSDATPLVGWRVLVPRPAGQERSLCAALAALGAESEVIAALCIEALAGRARRQAAAQLAALGECRHIIFVSANAVRCAVALARELGCGTAGWPPCYAVGPATAAALAAEGLSALAPVVGASGRALAQRPELQRLDGQRVMIVRGYGGRRGLGDTLVGRGAELDYCEVYRRGCPEASAAPLQRCLRAGRLDAAIATSAAMLDNLLRLADGEAGALRALPLCVPSQRLLGQARTAGFQQVATAPTAAAKSLAGTLAQAFARPWRVAAHPPQGRDL